MDSNILCRYCPTANIVYIFTRYSCAKFVFPKQLEIMENCYKPDRVLSKFLQRNKWESWIQASKNIYLQYENQYGNRRNFWEVLTYKIERKLKNIVISTCLFLYVTTFLCALTVMSPYVMGYILNLLNATFVDFYHISRNKLHMKEIKCALDLILYLTLLYSNWRILNIHIIQITCQTNTEWCVFLLSSQSSLYLAYF